MICSLVHATRGRPAQCLEARRLWQDRAHEPSSVEHIFAVDDDDAGTIQSTSGLPRVVVDTRQGNRGCVRAYNAAAKIATGDLLLNIEDDVEPPRDWDLILRCHARKGDRIYNCVFDVPGHPAFGLRAYTRDRYNRFGHMFFPGYKALFADFDAYWTARQEGALVNLMRLGFRHNHPFFTSKVKWDDTYQHENDEATRLLGMRLFDERWPGARQAIDSEVKPLRAAYEKQVWWCILPERCVYDISLDVALHVMEHNMKEGFRPIYAMYGRTDRNRQALADAFLELSKNDTDTLVMLDIDHDHPPSIVSRLVSHNVEVVSALMFCRTPPYTCSSYRHNGTSDLMPLGTFPPGLHPMHAVGTGAIAIQRRALLKLREAGHDVFFKFEYGNRSQWPGEDLYFSKLCEAHGVGMYVDTTTECPHITYGFVDRSTHDGWQEDHPMARMEVAL